jgi:hypothetical protein
MDYLKQLKSQLEGIAGNWNGDDEGMAEDRTHTANEGIELIEKLESILEELNIK